jgi:hypothetical protein
MSLIQLDEIKNKIKNKLDNKYLGSSKVALCQTKTNDYHIWLQLNKNNNICNTHIKIVDINKIGDTYFSGPSSHIYGIAYSTGEDFIVSIYKKPNITNIDINISEYLDKFKNINELDSNHLFTNKKLPIYIFDTKLEWIGYAQNISDIKYGMLNTYDNDIISLAHVQINNIDLIIIKID